MWQITMTVDVSLSGSAITPDEIAREIKQLPSAAKVLPRLARLLGDGNSSMEEIIALVRLDAGIAVRVLQLANSAFFSKGERCTTVDDAVYRVGYDHIYELVSVAVASQILVQPVQIYGIDSEDVWKLSVTCALAAEVLAERTGQDRNVAYTVGLLHGVGMIAIDDWSRRAGRRLDFQGGEFPREATEKERAAFGFTQADVGAALLRHWEFEPAMSEPVRLQYAPRGSVAHAKMAGLLYAARWVRSSICAKSLAARPPAPEVVHLQPLGLTPGILNIVSSDVARKLSTVGSLLNLEFDNPDKAERAQG